MTRGRMAIYIACLAALTAVGSNLPRSVNSAAESNLPGASDADDRQTDDPRSVVSQWMALVLQGKMRDSWALTTNGDSLDAQFYLPRLRNRGELRVERSLGNQSVAVVVTNSVKQHKSGKDRAFAFWLGKRDGRWLIDMSYLDDPTNIEQQLEGLFMGGGVNWHVSDADLVGNWLAGPGPAAGVGTSACGSRFQLLRDGSFSLEMWGPAGPSETREIRRGTWRLERDRLILLQGRQRLASRVSWVGDDSLVLRPAELKSRDGKFGTHYQREPAVQSRIEEDARRANSRRETPIAPVINPANEHYYAYVERQDITWREARDVAQAMSYRGLTGHLATITSEQENQFLLKHYEHRRHAWIGASDAGFEGEWVWVTGPEKGRRFWQGNSHGKGSGFASWRNGEPNNSFPSSQDPPDEDYAVFNYEHAGWNDLPNDPKKSVFRPHAFLVEFSLPSSALHGRPRERLTAAE